MDKPKPRRRALIVHAGAWNIPSAERPAHRRAVERAIEAGWAVLQRDGGALEAVRCAVQVMEADDALNAGVGSSLCRTGHVEMDAGLMDGLSLNVGAVAGLRTIKSPIAAAEVVLREKPVLLVGEGAEHWLAQRDVETAPPESFVTERERERLAAWLSRDPGQPDPTFVPTPGDTVGAVAVDHAGNLAAGTSTGGTCGKPPGRMGDSPVPGAGYYADNLSAGAACTGWGEALLRHNTAHRAVWHARENNAVDACWLAIRELEERFGGHGGIILIGRDSTIGWAFNTPAMAFAYMDDEMDQIMVGGLRDRQPREPSS